MLETNGKIGSFGKEIENIKKAKWKFYNLKIQQLEERNSWNGLSSRLETREKS